MTDIFSKAASKAKANAIKATVKTVQANEVKAEAKNAYEALNEKLQKAVIYAAFYSIYQKSGTLYNQASIDGLLANIGKALSDEDYSSFAQNVQVISEAIASVQENITVPLSATDIIKEALDASPDESPKVVLNRLISEKSITGADARRYLESLLGW